MRPLNKKQRLFGSRSNRGPGKYTTCDLHHVDVSKSSFFPVRNEAAAAGDEAPPFPERYALLLCDAPNKKEKKEKEDYIMNLLTLY